MPRTPTIPPAGASPRIGPLALLLLAAAGCGVEEVLLEPFRGETPHERYREALERSGLGESLLARSWLAAAGDALRHPVPVSLPFQEEGVFPAEHPTALAYEVELRRGELLRVTMDRTLTGSDEPGGVVFVDVFRIRDPDRTQDPDGRALLVADGDPSADTLVHEARASARYLIRIQPELLVEGPFRVLLESGPSLAFPVEDRSTRDVGSFFGDGRDAGARQHHGVDIFAPRGTPVRAAAAGVVRRTGTNRLGGNVVWLRDEERGISQYYAHLDTQLVEPGARVRPGDILGTVGNTGNARTTPPHLHFGLYVRGEGPVDPWPFLHDARRPVPSVRVDPALFLRRARLEDPERAGLLWGPSSESATLAGVDRNDEFRILAGAGDFYRVRLSDGRAGYVRAGAFRLQPDKPLPVPGVAGRKPSDSPAEPAPGA